MTLRWSLADLEEMARVHVAYEVSRLALWSQVSVPETMYSSTRLAPVLAELVGQATLESALIHLRNVADFIVADRPTANQRWRESDIVADDYFDAGWPGKPSHILGEDPESHRTTDTEINRRLAHISIHRLDRAELGAFEWQFVLTRVPVVLEGFNQFRTDLGSIHADRARWFE
jgi:hypothetical protein